MAPGRELRVRASVDYNEKKVTAGTPGWLKNKSGGSPEEAPREAKAPLAALDDKGNHRPAPGGKQAAGKQAKAVTPKSRLSKTVTARAIQQQQEEEADEEENDAFQQAGKGGKGGKENAASKRSSSSGAQPAKSSKSGKQQAGGKRASGAASGSPSSKQQQQQQATTSSGAAAAAAKNKNGKRTTPAKSSQDAAKAAKKQKQAAAEQAAADVEMVDDDDDHAAAYLQRAVPGLPGTYQKMVAAAGAGGSKGGRSQQAAAASDKQQQQQGGRKRKSDASPAAGRAARPQDVEEAEDDEEELAALRASGSMEPTTSNFLQLQDRYAHLFDKYEAAKAQSVSRMEAALEEGARLVAEHEAAARDLAMRYRGEAERLAASAELAAAQDYEEQLAALLQENLAVKQGLLKLESEHTELAAAHAAALEELAAYRSRSFAHAAAQTEGGAPVSAGVQCPSALHSSGSTPVPGGRHHLELMPEGLEGSLGTACVKGVQVSNATTTAAAGPSSGSAEHAPTPTAMGGGAGSALRYGSMPPPSVFLRAPRSIGKGTPQARPSPAHPLSYFAAANAAAAAAGGAGAGGAGGAQAESSQRPDMSLTGSTKYYAAGPQGGAPSAPRTASKAVTTLLGLSHVHVGGGTYVYTDDDSGFSFRLGPSLSTPGDLDYTPLKLGRASRVVPKFLTEEISFDRGEQKMFMRLVLTMLAQAEAAGGGEGEEAAAPGAEATTGA